MKSTKCKSQTELYLWHKHYYKTKMNDVETDVTTMS